LTASDARAFALEFLGFLAVPQDAVTSDAVDAIIERSEGSAAHLTRLCRLISVATEATGDLVIDTEVLTLLADETLVH
jgi:hypothetical protein